jgi:phage-related protein (TIGR01555 family)
LNQARHDEAVSLAARRAPNEIERADAAPPIPAELRQDGWVNAVVGFGGAKDKTTATTWDAAFARLNEAQLTGMYATEDLSAKIVNLYPRQALREGWKLTGFKPELADEVSDFLEPYMPETQTLHGLIWGRLYGGAATWFGNDDDPASPFVMGERVDFLRTIDKRFLHPVQNPGTLDVQGLPTFYEVRTAQGKVVGTVHASRLVIYPGEMTDDLTRQSLGHWDLSVLQRPYNALRSDGTVWKAAEYLMTEASMGVLKIKNLVSLVAAGQKALLSARLAILNMGRSFAKSMTLDKDTEEYSRETIAFAGIPELTDRALKRVASAAEIPVSVLIGEAPAGLNATGDNDLRWFLMQVQAYRMHVVQKRALRIIRALLSQPGSPVREAAPKVGIMWPELWTPSASEMADIFLKYSQGDVNYATAQIALPEEIALSRFAATGWSSVTTIVRKLREEALTGAVLPSEQLGADPTENAPGNAGAAGTNPRGVPGPAPKDGEAAPAAAGTVATAPGASGDIQKEALNGAQVTGLVEIVKSVAVGDLPVEAGVEIISLAYQVTPDDARKIIAGAGTTFNVKKPEPAPGGFGTPKDEETEPEEKKKKPPAKKLEE